jgi:NitT/TauT family transport system substrate-binding protein
MRLVRVDAPAERRRPPARASRALSAATATLALAALATGCQAGQGSGTTAAGTVAMTVAAIPGADNAPLYVAAAQGGLFSQAGLDVTIKPYQSVGEELKALKAGQVDVAAGDYADFFYTEATSRRPDLRIVADGYHAAPGVMEVLTGPDSGITTPHDLIGKIIGTPAPQVMPVTKAGVPYSLETVATQSVLENDGVDPAKVTWKRLPAGELINALADHHVNAILVQEPYIFEAQSRLGAIEVLDSCSGATASLPLTGYFAVQSFASKNRKALQDFRSALQQAQAQAVLPGPVHLVLAHHSGMSMQSASLVTIGAYPTSLDAAGLQRVADLMFNFGVLTAAFQVAPMVFH